MNGDRTMRRARVQGGFSLIELLVVIGIMTLFAVIALPKYSDITARAKLAKTKMNLLNIKNGFTNYYYDSMLKGGDAVFPPFPPDSLLTREWATATVMDDGRTVASLFSEGNIIYNPNNNPYVYSDLPQTDTENKGFALRDTDFKVEIHFRP